MVIGRCSDKHDIVEERVRIGFGDVEVYPAGPAPQVLDSEVRHLRGGTVVIWADPGVTTGAFTVYG